MFLLASGTITGAEVCANQVMAPVLNILAMVIMVFKIVIPILLIVFGMIDLGKAVTGAKDDEIKKSIKSFTMRCIAAVVIFLIPSLVGLVMSLVANSGIQGANEWTACKEALKL